MVIESLPDSVGSSSLLPVTAKRLQKSFPCDSIQFTDRNVNCAQAGTNNVRLANIYTRAIPLETSYSTEMICLNIYKIESK